MITLETMEQYGILRWLNQHGIAPRELETVAPNALRATMPDGSVTLYIRQEDGEITSLDQDPVC